MKTVRHRRGRVHRLELRALRAGQHRRRGHRLRRAHLRRQPREHPRRHRRSALPVRARRHLRPGRRRSRRWTATTRWCTSPPRRHVDRSIKDGHSFVRTNCFGTNVLCDVARQVGVRAVPAHLHRRGVRLDRGGLVHRDRPARPALAVLGGEGRQRPDRAAATSPPTACPWWSPGAATTSGRTSSPRRSSRCSPPTCSTARRCRCTATAATCATGSTWTTTTAPPTWCCARARSARSTTSARGNEITNRSSPTGCSSCAAATRASSSRSPTASATTVATRSHIDKISALGWTMRARPRRRAWPTTVAVVPRQPLRGGSR